MVWETEFGVLTKDNKLKPMGNYYKEVIQQIKCAEVSSPLKTGKTIVIGESQPLVGWKYGEMFARYIEKGEHVKFVLSSKVDDLEYLNKRGIKEIIII